MSMAGSSAKDDLAGHERGGEDRWSIQMLTKNQFDCLYAIKKHEPLLEAQLALAEELQGRGLVKRHAEKLEITAAGLEALAPYKVDNALIMAAGFSSRFAPISYEKPKGKLEVKGEVLIERQINQLKAAGIDKIVVVLGYMQEEFYYLEDKYENLTLLINPHYQTMNNISTLLVARGHLKNTYICSSDNYYTENVFEEYVYEPCYSAVYVSGPTDEYVVELDEEGYITGAQVSGRDAYVMLGYAYFTKDFSDEFMAFVDQDWPRGETKSKLWEQLYLDHIKELPPMRMQEHDSNVVWEFDSLDDLRVFDPDFFARTNSKVIANICEVLSCKPQDIKGFVPNQRGLTNRSFSFYVFGKRYIYRHPGLGTDLFVDRAREKAANERANELGIDPTYITMSSEEGWKISHYFTGYRELDYRSLDDLDILWEAIDRYQAAPTEGIKPMVYWDEGMVMLKSTREMGKLNGADFLKLEADATKLNALLRADSPPLVLCHHDIYHPNLFVMEDGSITIIDWEYAGLDDPAFEFAGLITNGEYSYEDACALAKRYVFKNKPYTTRQFAHLMGAIGLNGYYWFLWASYKDAVGFPAGDVLYSYYRYAKKYIKLGLDLYAQADKDAEASSCESL